MSADKMRDALHGAIMNLPCKRTMSHLSTKADLLHYKEGHRAARHAAAELVACHTAAAPVQADMRQTQVEIAAPVSRDSEKDRADAIEWAEGRESNLHAKFLASIAASAQAQCVTLDERAALTQIYDLFGIGSDARNIKTLMVNLRNTMRFSDMLHAVEREFFMVPGEPDDDYPDDEPDDECLLNSWGSTVEQYVEQFRAARAPLAAQAPASDAKRELTESAIAEAVRDWFPDRAYQADYFARALVTGQVHWTKRHLPDDVAALKEQK